MISRKWLGGLAGLLALAAAWSVIAADATAGSQPGPDLSATPEGPTPPQREVEEDPNLPAISFIDSPSPMCYRPVKGTGACYIQWDYLYVAATSPSYVVSMTVTIDGRVRAFHSGFFQTSMIVDDRMTNPGFRVTCGAPGAGGVSGMGNTYPFIIKARESGGLSAQNTGSVTCPADVVTVFMPAILKR